MAGKRGRGANSAPSRLPRRRHVLRDTSRNTQRGESGQCHVIRDTRPGVVHDLRRHECPAPCRPLAAVDVACRSPGVHCPGDGQSRSKNLPRTHPPAAWRHAPPRSWHSVVERTHQGRARRTAPLRRQSRARPGPRRASPASPPILGRPICLPRRRARLIASRLGSRPPQRPRPRVGSPRASAPVRFCCGSQNWITLVERVDPNAQGATYPQAAPPEIGPHVQRESLRSSALASVCHRVRTSIAPAQRGVRSPAFPSPQSPVYSYKPVSRNT
jgi:hypothetical protein